MTNRFYAKVKINATNGCHEWTGALSNKGYGRFAVKRKNRHAHRVAWQLANGPIPDGLWVLHKCDNPRCVNPKHLFLGTVLDNSRDMIAKGRAAPRFGEFGGTTILTQAQVHEIRNMPRNIDYQRYLAKLYGVTIQTIKAVQYRRSWRHI